MFLAASKSHKYLILSRGFSFSLSTVYSQLPGQVSKRTSPRQKALPLEPTFFASSQEMKFPKQQLWEVFSAYKLTELFDNLINQFFRVRSIFLEEA
jgi:hypothetical protein